jgi:hypothetical protein
LFARHAVLPGKSLWVAALVVGASKPSAATFGDFKQGAFALEGKSR